MSSFYNTSRTAKRFSGFLSQASTEWSIGYPAVLDLITSGSAVLDYGCGSGEFAFKLSDKVDEVLGVDKSEEMLTLARKKERPNVRFINSNKGIPAEYNGKFDFTTANFVFCTLTDGEVREALEEIDTALKPGGVLIILHSNWDRSNGKEFESFRMNKKEGLRDGDEVFVTLKSKHELIVRDFFRPIERYVSLLKSCGFETREIFEPTAVTINPPEEQAAFYIISAIKQ